jgi:hypothetical protein
MEKFGKSECLLILQIECLDELEEKTIIDLIHISLKKYIVFIIIG